MLFEKLKLRNFEIPNHLLDISLEPKTLRGDMADIRSRLNEIDTSLTVAASQTLQQISRSEDEVSKRLSSVFAEAVADTSEERQRARERKEKGNPPGKNNNPLGDHTARPACGAPANRAAFHAHLLCAAVPSQCPTTSCQALLPRYPDLHEWPSEPPPRAEGIPDDAQVDIRTNRCLTQAR